MAVGIGTVLLLGLGTAAVVKVASGGKKKKRTGAAAGLPKPLVAAYEYGDVTIAVWTQSKGPTAKGKEYAWGIYFDTEPEEVSGSKDVNGRWVSPVAVPLLRHTGVAKTIDQAKRDAQHTLDEVNALPPPLVVTYDFGGFVIAIWESEADPSRRYQWALFPGGTIDSVRSSNVGGRWIPPDGLMVAASGRGVDQATAEHDAEAATKQLVGEPASSGEPGQDSAPAPHESPSPPVSETLVAMFPEGSAHERLHRMPGLDEAVASADCGVVGIGPLFWDRAGNVVHYMLEQQMTSTSGLVTAVLRTFLPDCYRLRAPGIDALRDAVVDAVRKMKQEQNIP